MKKILTLTISALLLIGLYAFSEIPTVDQSQDDWLYATISCSSGNQYVGNTRTKVRYQCSTSGINAYSNHCTITKLEVEGGYGSWRESNWSINHMGEVCLNSGLSQYGIKENPCTCFTP